MALPPIQSPPEYCEYAGGPCDQIFAGARPAKLTFLYPSTPAHVAEVLEATAFNFKQRDGGQGYQTWRDLVTTGQVIFCSICKGMRFSRAVVVDVTTLNFNLLFEIGFALGLEIPVVPVRDTTILTNAEDFKELGLLDTIGYLDFQNSDTLYKGIHARLADLAHVPSARVDLNRETPLYVLKGPHDTEGDVKLLSMLKKSAVRFRTFDAKETPRLPLQEARRQVEASLAVVAHLLDPARKGAAVHNARCALLAGIAMATGRTVLLLQEGRVAQPIDYRDVVQSYGSANEIHAVVDPFLRNVITRLQGSSPKGRKPPERFLERLDLGDLAAENEILGLRSYFVRTAQFTDARRGLARLVVGRKGSGKTAIFYGIRDSIPRGAKHLLLDLKPEGHQFTKLRETILSKLSPGLQEHTLAAFWNFIILCELAQRIRDNEYSWAQRDATRREQFDRIRDVYSHQVSADAGDFSERLLRQVDRLTERFADSGQQQWTGGALTQALFKGEIRELEDALTPYLAEKDDVWILVDNLDKGWPTRGSSDADILVLRSLLDATRTLQRHLEKRNVECHSLVFLRNDIHDHLISTTSDRGKDTAISVDWDDVEALKHLIGARIRASTGIEGQFSDLWPMIVDAHVGTTDSFEWVASRTLMRPRDVLMLVRRAIGVAINRGHEKVQESDLLKAEEGYSEDLLLNTALELRDIYPAMIDLLYRFERQGPRLGRADVDRIIGEVVPTETARSAMVELLVWFGFLGVLESAHEEARYSYQEAYNVEKLLTTVRRGNAAFAIHPAFHQALSVPALGR